ncbi:hypothetical protein MMC15_006882 [Xylographa vitiligo]|nr:hypothetical protein [Xylographa vitiligo]
MTPPPLSPTLPLLRALLRECTYLPDPLARTYWHTRILARFRHHHRRHHPHKPPLPPSTDPRTTTTTTPRPAHKPATPLLAQARHALSTLRRANAGHLRPLETVLLHAYGRTGRRRHELMAALSRLDPPDETATPGRRAGHTTQSGGATAPTPPPPLLLPHAVSVVLKAQRARRGGGLWRPPIKTLQPAIPPADVWGRAFPACRARGLRRRWVARARESVLPPLEGGEWERLRDLAAGRVAWGGAVPRGGRGREEGRVGGRNPHRLTGRVMRRVWERMLVQCSVVVGEGRKGGWGVRWGEVERGGRGMGEGGRDAMGVFEGVDEDGRRLEVR